MRLRNASTELPALEQEVVMFWDTGTAHYNSVEKILAEIEINQQQENL